MNDRLKYRIYFKGSEYAKVGYVDLSRTDVIYSLRPDGQIIRDVVYECQQQGHEGSPCHMPFTPNNELYDIQFCTGLRDKNSRLIYDGDIIQGYTVPAVNEKWGMMEPYSATYKGVVIFKDFNFIVDAIGLTRCTLNLKELKTIEIIGNIYETPKLLEEICNSI